MEYTPSDYGRDVNRPESVGATARTRKLTTTQPGGNRLRLKVFIPDKAGQALRRFINLTELTWHLEN